ncbi:carbon monoxide dehydrogenase subunit G [Azoarcus sp. CIB]|uniref:CoxG family protein n=1 Tax=Aromatoleum sp. (strain CIB) TaxID=198107 RepID=UPI00067ACADE|nr:SRPBCC family protein [Azoarcus sp. CIB]AKU11381.1 carbon monoxide dehydrogenase subunit G [Azoarcus sp. CIB]
MALQIQEKFEVAAPVDAVWQFLLDPQNVVACMPGASLTEIVNADSFIGAVKLKIGAVTAQYQGTITYVEKDLAQHIVKLLASGNERGGGTVSGTIVTRLTPSPDGRSTEVSCESSIDLTGRILQVGRGMIEGVSAQIIKKYVNNVRALLEVPRDEASTAPSTAAEGGNAAPTAPESPPRAIPRKEDSINVVGVVFKVFLDRIAALFRRVFGRA